MCPELGIITGYLKNRPGIICKTYFDENDNYSLAEHAPWLSFFIGEKDASLDRKEMFRASLSIAFQPAKTDTFEKYYSGFSAFEKWIEELERHSILLKAHDFQEHEVNLTMVISLLDSRRAASDYLIMMNKSHPMNKGALIIDNYKKEVALLDTLFRNVLPAYDSGQKEWTADILKKQMDTLSQILEIEQESIGFIEEELKTFVY